MDKTTLQSIFSKPFVLADWQNLLTAIFGVRSLLQNPAAILLPNNDKAEAAFELGKFNTADSRLIGLYHVKVKPNVWLERNKVGLRELLRSVYQYDVDGAVIVFEQGDKWRLSFVSEIRTLNEEGELIESKTQPKRYTYLLGKGEKTKTPTDRFFTQKGKPFNLEDIRQLFSVATLTKEFYKELFTWYEWTLSDEIGITFPKNTNTANDDREKLEEQIIRLITRLLFVWFIKQKELVPNTLFDTAKLKTSLKDFDAASSTEGNYYNAILQNLFFATLNKAIPERGFAKTQTIRDIKTLYRYAEMFQIPEAEILELFKPVPFLNGGLFECLDKEDVEGNKYFLDGFSRNDKRATNGNFKHRAFIPNCVFFDEAKGIIPLLNRYNFTVEEHSPEDVQVALDPELLGNVFENLLGAYNTETKETARNQSGSFYTPREIVDFMVSESLQAYLNEKLGDINLNNELTDAQKKKVYDTLLKVKILDPACGSGAFPMGILNGIIALLTKIGVAETLDMYRLKLHLIENCIYGVDIQTIAAQISKLRFFISLIVEQHQKDESQENYGVLTLPNLETKFVAANTLIGIKKKKEGDFVGTLFEDPAIDTTKQEIIHVRHEHFNAKSANSKRTLREKDATLRNKLASFLEANHDSTPEDAKQLAQWNPYDQNSSAPFFDVEWMFGIKDGFDIVIGNPPYIQLQKDGGRMAQQFAGCGYQTFARTGDIYSLFYERGWQLLKPKGHLCFITSNKWMRAGYGESTRKFFAENTNPLLLIDFAGQKIFESATVDVNILMFAKDKNQQKTQACVVKEKLLNELSVFVRQEGAICNFNSAESWVILSDIEQRIKEKIERIGTPLKNWDIQINYGIKTGFNAAFIIDGAKRKELIAQDPKSDEIIRPILRGRDIKRYGYDFADLWLINTHNGIREEGIKPIDVNDYPAIKRHLDQYWNKLETRADQGVTPYNLRNCAYMEDFFEQKIMYPNMTKYLPFYLDDKGFMQNDKSFMITGNNISFLTAFLNSSIFKYCFIDNFPELQGGTRELRKIFLDKIPVVKVTKETNKEFEELVLKLQVLYQSHLITKELEIEIDERIFDLYSLTEEERRTIGFIEIQ
ncbi:MAG: Eco57I restriction-modification methylase domain-containing protein [Bacteroidetes bacterium]|nr:Eco57I restriction-modification methylase domain-containing protein [Bacteroidota bacterium]